MDKTLLVRGARISYSIWEVGGNYTFQQLANVGLPPNNSRQISSLGFSFRDSPHGFKTRLLGEGFHTTLVKGVLFSSPTNVGHHNPPPSEPSVLVALFPFSNRFGTHAKSTPFGASVLTGTPSRVYPIRRTASSLAYSPVYGSNTICNNPGPSLSDIVLFGQKLSWLCFEGKPERKSQKRTISASGGSGPLHKQLPFRLN